ncbi:MAG TPA: FAD-dependent monooxygenase [Bryobacteraceae bacterium]|nr:FAD-dependent monooxygenase [Bryobacteraceae bacterium]
MDPDVFIVGGGPAGLAAAIAARRRGLSVVVADGNRPPIDKPCGEGLMPDSRRHAERLGIHLPASLGFEFRGIRFHGAGHSVESNFPTGRGVGIRRTALHAALISAAEHAGVELRWETPITEFDGIAAEWIIGADGYLSRVRAWAGLNDCAANDVRYAYRRHFGIVPWTDCMEIHWAEGCQMYVTPVAPNEVCVALISRAPELRIEAALSQFFPSLQERVSRALPTSRERGSITACMRLRSVARGNIALIGDASGSVDAITGEGICLSFRQAEVLADALVRGDLNLYERAHPRLMLRPHLMAKTMLLLDKGPGWREWIMSAMTSQPWIFRSLLAVHVL